MQNKHKRKKLSAQTIWIKFFANQNKIIEKAVWQSTQFHLLALTTKLNVSVQFQNANTNIELDFLEYQNVATLNK